MVESQDDNEVIGLMDHDDTSAAIIRQKPDANEIDNHPSVVDDNIEGVSSKEKALEEPLTLTDRDTNEGNVDSNVCGRFEESINEEQDAEKTVKLPEIMVSMEVIADDKQEDLIIDLTENVSCETAESGLSPEEQNEKDAEKLPDIMVMMDIIGEDGPEPIISKADSQEVNDGSHDKSEDISDESHEEENAKAPSKGKLKRSKDDDYDPDKFREKLRRLYLIHRKGYVRLRTFSRNNSTGEFHLDTTLVKRSELPKKAVVCTGEKRTYCLDLVKDSPWYIENHYKNLLEKESQFTAADAALYMQSNKIDNALAINWTSMAHVDPMKYILLAAGGLLVLLFVIMRL